MSEKQNVGEINEKINAILKGIGGLNLGQISQLIDEIKKEYNIEETAIVQTTGVQTSEKVEEKSSNVSVKLVDIGAQKIPIYKVIIDLVEGLNIIEAKKLAEKGVILENVSQEKAEEAKKLLEEKGAKVEIK
jgi:ribosomal protein L7/L12